MNPTRQIVGLRAWSLRLVTSGIGNSGTLYRSGHRMGLRQDANPRVSLAAADLSTRTSRHRSWGHSNDKRTLVIHSLDDGRSSRARRAGLQYAPPVNSRLTRGKRLRLPHRRPAASLGLRRQVLTSLQVYTFLVKLLNLRHPGNISSQIKVE